MAIWAASSARRWAVRVLLGGGGSGVVLVVFMTFPQASGAGAVTGSRRRPPAGRLAKALDGAPRELPRGLQHHEGHAAPPTPAVTVTVTDTVTDTVTVTGKGTVTGTDTVPDRDTVTVTDTDTDADTATVTVTVTATVTVPVTATDTDTGRVRLAAATRYNGPMGRESDRIAELSREIDANPHSRQFYQLGELLRREGRAEEACTVLARGLQHWPKYVAAWVSLGRAELERRSAPGAVGALEKALELDPENPVAWRLLAEARELAGELAGAVAAMRRAAGLVPGDDTLVQALQRLEGLAAAPRPLGVPKAAAPDVSPLPEPAPADQGEEVQETAAVAARAVPLPEPFAQAPGLAAALPAPPEVVEKRRVAVAEAEPFAMAEPFAIAEPAPETSVEVGFKAIAEPAPEIFAEPAPEDAVASPPQELAIPTLETLPALEAEGVGEAALAPLAVSAHREPAPAPTPAAPFGELPPPPVGEEGEAPGEVFGVAAPVGAAVLEDVFGAAEKRPLPVAAEPLPAAEEPPFGVEETSPAQEEPAPWVTQARFVVPIPPATAEESGLAMEEPPGELPHAVDEVLAGEPPARTGAPLAEPPVEELWPPAAVDAGPREAPAEVAAPVVSVEAARTLIRAERLTEAAAMLERVLHEQGEDGEARDLLELVRDMLEPMPVEVPPLSLRERKIAALQRWLASLTLARERAAL